MTIIDKDIDSQIMCGVIIFFFIYHMNIDLFNKNMIYRNNMLFFYSKILDCNKLLVDYYHLFKQFIVITKEIMNLDAENIIATNENNINERYEDKYLVKFRKLNRDFEFNEEELIMEKIKFQEFYKNKESKYTDKINEYNILIQDNKDELIFIDESLSSSSSNYEDERKKYEYIIHIYNNEIQAIQLLLDDKLAIQESASKKARQYIIDERLDKLKNSYIIEKTPQGNVLMFYNNKRGSFEYYSDNTIPYRYLETVGRKYVTIFNCRSIYVDMEEELKLSEEKILLKEKELKKLEEERILLEETNKNNNVQAIEPKKSVFAKFKSYNKDAGTGRVNSGVAPKNSIPNNPIKETSEKILLKENANRYSYEGKFSNFQFLKKVERKIVDKKYGMTFADFKKSNMYVSK